MDSEEFDNLDNPWGELKLHRYTNMASADAPEGEVIDVKDEIIDLKECTEGETDMWSTNLKIYCPDYKDDQFLYGDYTTDQYSWLRLAVHYCDSKIRTCEEQWKMDSFFKTTIISLKLD